MSGESGAGSESGPGAQSDPRSRAATDPRHGAGPGPDRRPIPGPDPDIAAWIARAPRVPPEWFRHESRLHGVGHTQRVHIHTQRLAEVLDWRDDDTRLALRSALLHDIGRWHDGLDPWHGASSATRAERLGLADDLSRAEADLVLFAVKYHSRSDERAVATLDRWAARQGRGGDADGLDPYRALRVLWLLKDADALDRVRLPLDEGADPRLLRHPETIALMPFAEELYAALKS